jgi:hypothetical protein
MGMGMVDPMQLFRRYGPLRVNPPNTMQGSGIEQWFKEDIHYIAMTCGILHNMMVEVRVARDEQESAGWYEAATENAIVPIDVSIGAVQRLHDEINEHSENLSPFDAQALRQRHLTSNIADDINLHRRRRLYNSMTNARLRQAIIRQLTINQSVQRQDLQVNA